MCWALRFGLCLALGGLAAGPGLFGGEPPRAIPGWGTVIDPDGDCAVQAADGKLTIRLPSRPHDLWYGRKEERTRFNAPRVVQTVEGDFVAQVKVTADWRVGPGPPYFFLGAGLVVWDSGNQYLRLERDIGNYAQTKEYCYSAPLYDRNGKRMQKERVTTPDFFKGASTWLRVERTGQTMTTSISHDGTSWMQTGVLTTEFPARVQVGVHAIDTATNRDFVVTFENFSVRRR